MSSQVATQPAWNPLHSGFKCVWLKSLLRTSTFTKIKQIPIALQIKTSLAIGIGDWVSHRL